MDLKFQIIPSEGGYRVPLPQAATPGSAGLDLRVCSDGDITIEPGCRAIVRTGLAVELPEGCVGLVFSRSGLGARGVTLSNSVGVIDSDYRGELRVSLINHGQDSFTAAPGDRVAQLVVVPCLAASPVEAESLGSTRRGDGGYGSTGLK